MYHQFPWSATPTRLISGTLFILHYKRFYYNYHFTSFSKERYNLIFFFSVLNVFVVKFRIVLC